MEGLRLTEETDGRLTLDLRAARATFDRDRQAAAFTDLVARFDLEEARVRGITLAAAHGRSSERGRLWELEGRVRARDAQGRTLAAESARYDRGRRVLEAPAGAVATFARGTARAPHAHLDVAKERLTLWGGVVAEVIP